VPQSQAQRKRTDKRSIKTKPTAVLRILVADDHLLFRRFVCGVLAAEGWQVCGEASNGREAVERALELKPDVVVLDLSMPELSGLDAARQIVKQMPGVIAVILTLDDLVDLSRAVLAAGAAGCVLKTDLQRLVTHVRNARRDRVA
jgi:DNA-binding NarL/FixJ family response regulator